LKARHLEVRRAAAFCLDAAAEVAHGPQAKSSPQPAAPAVTAAQASLSAPWSKRTIINVFGRSGHVRIMVQVLVLRPTYGGRC
jgi:hypothetical protein